MALESLAKLTGQDFSRDAEGSLLAARRADRSVASLVSPPRIERRAAGGDRRDGQRRGDRRSRNDAAANHALARVRREARNAREFRRLSEAADQVGYG